MTDRPQHTPGPWSFSPQDGGKNHCNVAQVWDANGNSLAIIETTDDPAIASANAALIARAPELLARVEEFEKSQANLAMLVQRLIRRARHFDANCRVAKQALDYLVRNNLMPSILRGEVIDE